MLHGQVHRLAAGLRCRHVLVAFKRALTAKPDARAVGRCIATALGGAWRSEPGPFVPGIAGLSPCVETLIRTGAGALVWRRLASMTWRGHPDVDALRRAHHIDRVRAALNVRSVEATITRMRAVGIEPILLKGWSVAAVYSDPALRPLGDIDLLVHEIDGARAQWEADAPDVKRPPIDVHTALLDLTDRSTPALFERSRMIPLGGISVRVLGWEDHVRHLCLHFFRHAGWRPLWLCDIAATLEAMPQDFNWDLCLSGDRLLTERVIAGVGLAGVLLDARPSVPIPARWRQEMPAWLPRAVLRSWGAPFDPLVYQPTAVSLSLRDPGQVLPALMRRWPNPLEATVHRAASLTGRWRPLVQLEEAGARALGFLRRSRALAAVGSTLPSAAR